MKIVSNKTLKVLGNLSDSIIEDLDLDKEIIRDCFPLKKPYRIQAGEALLTIETRMKKKLKIRGKTGIDIIADAKIMGVFKRKDPSEEQGMELLFRGSVLSLQNILHHNKPKMDKEEAIKIILFADYLIKLFEVLIKENKIK